jgi:cytochrome P450
MFFMAMILYPEVQKKAQKELDAVIGNTRLPNLKDRAQLDYVGRLVQEVLRWAPVTPLGELMNISRHLKLIFI